jgi:hypothetical protein
MGVAVTGTSGQVHDFKTAEAFSAALHFEGKSPGIRRDDDGFHRITSLGD